MYSPADGGVPTKINVYDFKSAGVALAMYNTDEVSVGLAFALTFALLQALGGFRHIWLGASLECCC